MGRRGNHEGSVVEDKARGGYRGGVTLADGSRRWVRAKTKPEVIKKMQVLQGHAAAGTAPPSGTMPLGQAARYWFDVVLPARRRAPATVEQYRWAVDIISDEMGRARLSLLSVERVEAFLRTLADEGYSANSIRIIRLAMNQVLTEAERRGHVTRNVARLAVMPHDAAQPTPRRALTTDECARLLQAAAGDRLEALYVLALATGARKGELLGLAWDDVDLDASTLSITKALRRSARGGYEVGPTKTTASVRKVTLGPTTVAALRAHKRRQAEERLAAGERWHDEGLVFTTTLGGHVDPRALQRSWDAVCKRAGVEATFHEIRHTVGSHVVEADVPLATAADQLGHSVDMLARTYRHRVSPVVDVAGVTEALVAQPGRQGDQRLPT
jgi:integrase